jgi:hypothetical protein
MLRLKQMEADIWCYAEIVGQSGSVLSRAEGEITEEGDLASLVRTATDYYRNGHPDENLLTDMDQGGYLIRVGKT